MGPPFQGAQGTPWAGLGDLGDQGTLFGVLRVPLRVCGVSGGDHRTPFWHAQCALQDVGGVWAIRHPHLGSSGCPLGKFGVLGGSGSPFRVLRVPTWDLGAPAWNTLGAWDPGSLGCPHDQGSYLGCVWCPPGVLWVPIWDVWGAHLTGCPLGVPWGVHLGPLDPPIHDSQDAHPTGAPIWGTLGAHSG